MSQPKESKMKRVLIIAHAFPPFQSVGHSIRAIKFIKYLPTLGWIPSVLTIDDRKEYEADRKLGSETLLMEISKGVLIYRANAGEPSLEFLEREKRFGQRNWFTAVIVKLVGGTRRWMIRNLALPDPRITWLPFAVNLGRQVVNREKIDVIFTTCPPHSATLIGVFLKLLTRRPLILDFRDDWIDTPVYYSRSSIRRLIERKMEQWAVQIADKVILVTEWSKRAFLNRYPSQPRDKFVYIPNGCDLEEFKISTPKRPKPRNPKLTIVHAGSLNDSKYWARSPGPFFQAIHQIFENQPDMKEKIVLNFTGFLPERQKMLVEELGISSVVQELGFLPRDQWISNLKEADLLLVINYEGFSTLIPGKIYEYWAIGGPPILLLSCLGAAADLVKYHNLGFTVDPCDSEGIQRVILNVYRQMNTVKPLRINTTGIEAYDRKELAGHLAKLLLNVSMIDKT